MKDYKFVIMIIVTILQCSTVFCFCKVRHADFTRKLFLFRVEQFGNYIRDFISKFQFNAFRFYRETGKIII